MRRVRTDVSAQKAQEAAEKNAKRQDKLERANKAARKEKKGARLLKKITESTLDEIMVSPCVNSQSDMGEDSNDGKCPTAYCKYQY